MACYGFPFNIYYDMLSKNAYIPGGKPLYDTIVQGTFSQDGSGPNGNTLGFTNYYDPGTCQDNQKYIQSNQNYPDWVSGVNGSVDFRAAYVYCFGPNNANYCPQFTWPTTVVDSISPVTNYQVAYTTEVLFYAQSGYFVTIVMIQWSNVFACKSRKVIIALYR